MMIIHDRLIVHLCDVVWEETVVCVWVFCSTAFCSAERRSWKSLCPGCVGTAVISFARFMNLTTVYIFSESALNNRSETATIEGYLVVQAGLRNQGLLSLLWRRQTLDVQFLP